MRKSGRLSIVLLVGSLVSFFLYNFFVAIGEWGDYPEKIWLHRCNSMEKLFEKEKRYPNVEVDVVFRSDNTFDVTHDVDTSFHLSIASYFEYLQKEDGKIWLDIKNLIHSNKEVMLATLDSLVNRYKISKDRLVIESPSWQSLDIFTRNGYYTSMYVSYPKPNQMDE